MKSSVTKKSYTLIDIIKLLLAVLILISHYLNEYADGKLPKLLNLVVSIYIIAVPMYFAFSGYFIFKKVYSSNPSGSKDFIKNYCLKIIRLYGIWSLIYMSFQVITWIRFTPSSEEVFSYIHRALVYSTYNTIWFLPATAVGAVLSVVLRKYFGDKGMFCIAFVFCLIGAFGDCYYNITEKIPVIGRLFATYRAVFITTRNGIFNGFPYIAVGAMVAYKHCRDEKEYSPIINRYFGASIVFSVLFIIEAVISKLKLEAPNSNTVIMLFPFTFCVVYYCIISAQPRISGSISLFIRKMSTAIFLSQRLFLSAFPALLPTTVFAVMLDEKSWIVGLCWVTTCTLIFSAVLIAFSRKVRFLKFFYE